MPFISARVALPIIAVVAFIAAVAGVVSGMNASSSVTDDEGATVHCCQGPPRCLLEDDAAVKAQEDGCVWCKRIYIAPDGSERVVEPGNA